MKHNIHPPRIECGGHCPAGVPHVWCTFGIFGASAISALYLEPARAGSRWLSGSQNCDSDADSLLFTFSTPFGIIGYTDGIIESNRLWATSTSSVHHRAPSFRSWCLAEFIWTPTASALWISIEANGQSSRQPTARLEKSKEPKDRH